MSDKIQEHCFAMHKEKVFVCSVQDCFKYFKSGNGLRLHCKDYHTDVLKCQQCNKVCTSYSGLNSHINAAHVAAKFACEHCKKTFTHDSDTCRHWNYSCLENENRYIHCKHCSKQTEILIYQVQKQVL